VLLAKAMEIFNTTVLRRIVDCGGTQRFMRCYKGHLMEVSIRRKVQTDCRSVPGWLKRFSDMLSNPKEYLQEATCPLQGLTGIPSDARCDESRARLMYAYEACVSACCLCIRLCSVDCYGRLVLGCYRWQTIYLWNGTSKAATLWITTCGPIEFEIRLSTSKVVYRRNTSSKLTRIPAARFISA